MKEQANLEEAISCYKAAIEIRPDFAIAHANLAACYYDKKLLSEAVSTFKHAIQLEPNFPDAFNNLGNALRESGQEKLEEAIYCYRTALRLKPDHPHAYNNLGNAMKDKGCVKEAIHCYVTAARLMPCLAAAHSNLGSILKEQNKVQQVSGSRRSVNLFFACICGGLAFYEFLTGSLVLYFLFMHLSEGSCAFPGGGAHRPTFCGCL